MKNFHGLRRARYRGMEKMSDLPSISVPVFKLVSTPFPMG